MLHVSYSKQLARDLRRMLKREKNGENVKNIMRQLINEKQLEHRYRDHKLVGGYKDRRECHIEPDWLLIYKKSREVIVFERTGTHADLFD